MIHPRAHRRAITAALVAVVVAFPFRAAGQASPDAYEQQVRRDGIRSCLVYDVCPDFPDFPDALEGPDRRVLLTVHGWDGRPARILFGAADASAYPVFVAAPVALWGAVLTDALEIGDALAGSAALAAGYGTAVALKRVVGRPRPYATIPGVTPRSGYAGTMGLSDTASFPSGHGTLAGVVATGAAILLRHPAATAAGGVWAVSVSVSRLWLGVHYPSDVAAGLAVGAGSAALAMSVLR
ncbi:MAG: phosphatase PAP2 family protein [Rhodothermales bacterium]|nr:phosphatase PAP2 family protein [Rhodothermales bacterium]